MSGDLTNDKFVSGFSLLLGYDKTRFNKMVVFPYLGKSPPINFPVKSYEKKPRKTYAFVPFRLKKSDEIVVMDCCQNLRLK